MCGCVSVCACALERYGFEIVFRCLGDDGNPIDADLLANVKRWASEWELVRYGHDLNLTCGLAPSTKMLLERAHTIQDCLPPAVKFAESVSPYGAASNEGRIWAHRFRRRWNVRLGDVKISEPMDINELHEKARNISCAFQHGRLHTSVNNHRCGCRCVWV